MDSCNFLFDVEKGKFHFSRSCFNRRRRRWWWRRWGVVHARLFWTGTSFTTLHDTGLCHWRTTAPWWILITQKERERETLQDTVGGLEKKKKLRVTFFLFSQDIYILRSTIAALACVEKQHISCVILAVVVFLLLLTTIFHRDQQFFVFFIYDLSGRVCRFVRIGNRHWPHPAFSSLRWRKFRLSTVLIDPILFSRGKDFKSISLNCRRLLLPFLDWIACHR